jgi:hypothetical protein
MQRTRTYLSSKEFIMDDALLQDRALPTIKARTLLQTDQIQMLLMRSACYENYEKETTRVIPVLKALQHDHTSLF